MNTIKDPTATEKTVDTAKGSAGKKKNKKKTTNIRSDAQENAYS